MMEMTMLDPDTLTLSQLVEALEDNSPEAGWWLDPKSGEFHYWNDQFDSEVDSPHPEEADYLYIEPIGSREAYGDMEDFIALLGSGQAPDRLSRAIEGRGAFRRFKDALFEYPELPRQWSAFHDHRMKKRAIEWLQDHSLVDDAHAEAATDGLVEPTVVYDDPTATVEARLDHLERIARRVADEAKAVGWLDPSATTPVPLLQGAIRELADTLNS